MYRMLSTLSHNQYFNFPLTIVHRDKPDFELLQPEFSIGIEITKATSEQFEWAVALRDKHFPDAFLDLSHFKWGAPQKSKKEILKILEVSQYRLTGPEMYGYQIENEWAKGIHECLSIKTQKLNGKEFNSFDKNWLLIYDNLRTAGFNDQIAAECLLKLLGTYWQDRSEHRLKFDRILIESGKYFLLITEAELIKLKIVDLWQ